MSSSPLPSPSAIKTAPPQPQTGTRKTLIPQDAPTGFLRASNLVSKEELLADYALPLPRRPSKTPSLEDYVYQGPTAPPQPKSTASGKLKRPTKSKQAVKDGEDVAHPDMEAKPAPRKHATKKSAQIVAETAAESKSAVAAPKRTRKKATTAESTEKAPAPAKRDRKPAIPKGSHAQDANPPVAKPGERTVKSKDSIENAQNAEFAPPATEHIEEGTGHSIPSTDAPATHVDGEPKAEDRISGTLHAQRVPISSEHVTLDEQNDDGHVVSRHFQSEAVRPTSPQDLTSGAITELDIAPRRRNDWTPPPELNPHATNSVSLLTAIPIEHAHEDVPPLVEPLDPRSVTHVQSEPVSPMDKTTFASLVGGFGYKDGEPVSRQPSDATRTEPVVETAPPKKRREPKKKAPPKDKAEPKPKAERKKREPKPKVPKPPKELKPKAPRKAPKKPLTITALATAAYRQQPLEAAETSDVVTLTSYFQPQGDDAPLTAGPQAGNEIGPPPQAAKRKATGDKPPSKRKRKSEPLLPTLVSPEKAHEAMRKQEWLFGTSSQLAAVESPTEYRDLQQAIQASEGFGSSQPMGGSQLVEAFRAASKARVPTAPHGTDLSIGQAHRDLWLSAARDSGQGTYAADDEVIATTEGLTFVDTFELPTPERAPMAMVKAIEEETTRALPTSPERATEPDDAHDSGYVDIDDIASIASASKLPATKPPDDYIDLVVSSSAPTVRTEELPSRSILRTLDPNANISKQDTEVDGKTPSPQKQLPARSIGTAVESPISLISPVKRPVGRPRKVVDASMSKPLRLSLSPARAATNRRSVSPMPDPPLPQVLPASGPRRSPASSPDPPLSQRRPVGRPRTIVKGTMTSITSLKPRGRPPKLVSAMSDPIPRSPKRPRLSKSATTQPLLSSPYLDIDDISDAEAASSPPSPPKRRSKSPVAQRTLELSNPAAANALEKPSSEKQLQANWPSISVQVFPRITNTVKAQPRTTDNKFPSWNEKILLYDPIVLEDLTLWLNSEGVRFDVERLVKVPAKKGRKRKNKDNEGVLQELEMDKGKENEVMETEIVKEELRPWMVQKWCELHSICCLWKEGLRGGVRQRY